MNRYLFWFGHSFRPFGRHQLRVFQELVELAVVERQMSRDGFQLVTGVGTFRTLRRIRNQIAQFVHEMPWDMIATVWFVKGLEKIFYRFKSSTL